MKKRKIILLLAIPLLALLFIGATNDIYYKINKSFDIFGEMFKEISSQYVEELDPEDLMKDAIYGMLSNLDPYTVYMDASESDEMDILTDGNYNGLGITVSVRDGMLTLTEIMDDSPAQKCGLRIGDRLIKIDTTETLNLEPFEIRKFTNKPIGQKLNFWVIRDANPDTLNFNITVEEINLKNVSYSDIIMDSIGYIKLERFTKNSAGEVIESLKRFKRSGKIKAMILDLRDNPGGLLESAARITELFIPKNSIIVTTKTRKKTVEREYKSLNEPMEPDIPLAVLINNGSASASEIVAGALQDLDRAIIIGEKSFGKGLVQSIFSLPYDGLIKITTSKYYTPSGRCIQKINYSKKKEKAHDTITFYTKNGRKVQELNGIMPDSIIASKSQSDYIKQLITNDVFFKFANIYTSRLNSIPDNFEINSNIINQFKEFLNEIKYFESTPNYLRIDEILEKIENEKIGNTLSSKLKKIQNDILTEEKKLFDKHKDEISKYLKIEILTRFKTQKEIIKLNLFDDDFINTAANMLQSKTYKKTLALDKKEEKLNKY